MQQKTLDLLVQVGLWVPEDTQPTVEVLALHAGVTGSEVAALLELMDSLDSDDAEVSLDALPAETMPVTAAVAQWGVDTLKPVVDKVAAFTPTPITGRSLSHLSVRPWFGRPWLLSCGNVPWARKIAQRLWVSPPGRPVHG